MMTKNEMLTHLQEWAATHDRLDQEWDRMSGAFGVSMVETPLWRASWGVFEAYTKTLGDLIGDPGGGWLDWFCYENDMGGKVHEAGYDGQMRPIETLGDLADLIIEGRGRG
jgi:hypothetical protein